MSTKTLLPPPSHNGCNENEMSLIIMVKYSLDLDKCQQKPCRPLPGKVLIIMVK